MAQDIVGSKMKTFASELTQQSTRGFGQNGYAGASSEPIGTAKKISKTYSGLAGEVNVSATAGEGFQTRTVSAKPYPSAFGMKSPSAPAKLPGVTARRDKTGVARPTR